MTYSSKRRTLLLAAATAPLVLTVTACASRQAAAPDEASAAAAVAAAAVAPAAAGQMLAELESSVGGRLGVCAIDTASGRVIAHRADERFPFCSTFKAMLSAAVLAQSVARPALLQQRVTYTRADLVNYSPVSEKHVGEGMTVAALCEAAIQYSDNSAANLLMKLLGGPSAVTAYARSIGDDTFRLDRWETELNTALPGDLRDTTTPAAMAASMRVLMVGDALPAAQRAQLVAWMRGNKVGDKRLRAGVPAGWTVGDKTGTGDYGTTNDAGVVWSPSRVPIAVAVYYTQARADARSKDDVIASVARIVVQAFG
ncbi:TPA: PEN family class A beta-lactamase, Bcc-type [Burkholderia cepacia]|uniref:PEN family class A beta-lactamase, Bcc-type n=1 Tax=Burkholderia cepacia TaxID=292 RepID=UPI001CF5EAB9|nr:PEN family class A beta-lactamase, Bcc-type [Burkholderia cepacia]HDR9756133.1 PenA family class A beta-lactamase [Burkholderia cepacia ATCC 25416]MCA8360271.1 PenA family class A beta-lactamase [Burkholderia cepacia]HDR9764410.1 PenA family class A beta-lactamase [Burkholderia cepacia ATCC 25416]HDV6370665.1 PenA family class A beta-lactamase [Burkholderia cepacia]HDV6372112.1 PenA family class A beta-lactamase [Burkholderia cepacia]